MTLRLHVFFLCITNLLLSATKFKESFHFDLCQILFMNKILFVFALYSSYLVLSFSLLSLKLQVFKQIFFLLLFYDLLHFLKIFKWLLLLKHLLINLLFFIFSLYVRIFKDLTLTLREVNSWFVESVFRSRGRIGFSLILMLILLLVQFFWSVNLMFLFSLSKHGLWVFFWVNKFVDINFWKLFRFLTLCWA
jgi:hypothetical protein